MSAPAKKRAVVLISGRGSNLGALIEAAAEPGYPVEIAGVVSDRAEAKGLEAGGRRNIPARVIARQEFPTQEAHNAALEAAMREFRAEIVCLAGYMRLMSPDLVGAWEGRMINIHPSLLPAFKGLDPHVRALAAGVRIHGCTVHFVTHDVDAGPIIAQAAVPVLPSDTEATLAARVLAAEHKLYPLALAMVADGRARFENGRAVLKESDVGAAAPMFSPAPARERETASDLEALARFTP